ncbi:methyltransferase C-terminal domain-containing protein [Pelagibacteraceae bacterium]|jgi:hypothetical protein|nr:methyltransferase C-terminal domain-containing protein [Pelagibacteraceae bacterium]
MKIQKCRNCNKKKLDFLFSLGKQSFTGKFPKKNKTIQKAPLEIIICKNCKLIQLAHRFNLKYLYGPDYGYRSNISKTMVNHLKKVVLNVTKKVKLKSGELVLDIASNDATLLKNYSKNIITFGIDPLINKYIKDYKKINYKISNFFSLREIKKKTRKKFKIITALSVFYDLEKPNKFLSNIKKILDEEGIFVLEFADLVSILKKKMFDTICHEHLEYYSSKIIIDMCKDNGLKVIDISENDINGSSKQFFISHSKSTYIINVKKIKKILLEEKKMKITSKKTILKFFQEINIIKFKLLKLIKKIKLKNQSIHGYGASTKGNVLLQYFGIGNNYLDYIAERNPKKYNLYTPGSNIKIISEKESRDKKPNFYLVLPWHFKKEILNREKKIRSKGVKFIFPLPKLKIY